MTNAYLPTSSVSIYDPCIPTNQDSYLWSIHICQPSSISMIHEYLSTKLNMHLWPMHTYPQAHVYDSCIPTNHKSITRPDQKIKARLALCSQCNSSQCLLPLPCLLAVTDDRIEAGLFKLQPLLLYFIRQLQHHLPQPSLLACITASKLIKLDSRLRCCISSSSSSTISHCPPPRMHNRIEADHIRFQPAMLNCIQQPSSNWGTISTLLACITAVQLIPWGSSLCCWITSSNCSTIYESYIHLSIRFNHPLIYAFIYLSTIYWFIHSSQSPMTHRLISSFIDLSII